MSAAAFLRRPWAGEVFESAPALLRRKWLYKDGLNPVYEEAWDSASSTWVQTRFVYASRANVPDFVIRDNVTYRIIADHLGSPRLVINTTNGLVVQKIATQEPSRLPSEIPLSI